MRQLNAIIQTSLDGFVAGPQGEFDNFTGGEENLGFVCGITKSADAAMFGRVSYQLLDADWPGVASRPGASQNEVRYSNWYNGAEKIVFSRTLSDQGKKGTMLLNDIRPGELEAIKKQQGKDILLFGSPGIARQLMEHRLLDHLWLIVHPVIFGNGIPLFRKTEQVSRFALQMTHALPNGTLCNQYRLLK